MTRALLDRCNRIAAEQYGAISLQQALGTGLSPNAVKRLSLEGIWTRVLPRTYVLWTPSGRDQLLRQRLMAGTLWLGEHSAISHRAGALVLGFDGLKTAPLEFSTTSRRRPVAPGIIVHRTRVLAGKDIVTRDRLRVTSAPRTLVDLATVEEAEIVELALESALRSGQATLDHIRDAVASAPRAQAGLRLMRFLLEHHPGRATDSALETVVWRIIRTSKLPLPHRQYVIKLAGSRRAARVDFAYPDNMLVIEADGFDSHSSKRDFTRDRSRQNELVRLGWIVYRVTWRDVRTRPEGVIADIRQLLAKAAS